MCEVRPTCGCPQSVTYPNSAGMCANMRDTTRGCVLRTNARCLLHREPRLSTCRHDFSSSCSLEISGSRVHVHVWSSAPVCTVLARPHIHMRSCRFDCRRTFTPACVSVDMQISTPDQVYKSSNVNVKKSTRAHVDTTACPVLTSSHSLIRKRSCAHVYTWTCSCAREPWY